MIRTCIKCLHEKSKVFYCTGLLERGCPVEICLSGDEGFPAEEIKKREHLHCECEICGYKWPTTCADAKNMQEE
jgi:hypothetical protein